MLKSKKRFILSTDSLNSQGFRMLTAGCDMTDFNRNPVLLFNHIRPEGNAVDQILPLGYWEDIELKNGELSAVPVFDDSDEFAVKIYNKVENGTIKMCSAGAEPLASSDDPDDLVPGQVLETVTKWMLKEGSLCDIGANPDALAVVLYDKSNKRITLAESGIKTIPTLIKPDMKTKKLTAAQLAAAKQKFVALADGLATDLKGLSAGALESAKKKILQLADDLDKKMSDEDPEKALADDEGADDKDAQIADLKAKLADMEKKCTELTEKLALADEDDDTPAGDGDDTPETKAKKLADAALKMRKITLKEHASIVKLATGDYDSTLAMLKARKAAPSVKEALDDKTTKTEGEEARVLELSKKSWDELFTGGHIPYLQLNAPDVYKTKYKTKFGKEPKNV